MQIYHTNTVERVIFAFSIYLFFSEPYTIREARIHVRHVRDLVRSVDVCDAINGVEGASMSFVDTIAAYGGERSSNNGTNNNRRANSIERTVIDCTPPEYVLPGAKERPLLHLLPLCKESTLQCYKSLAFSAYNPPPGYRKMKG
jgi:protein TIF31